VDEPKDHAGGQTDGSWLDIDCDTCAMKGTGECKDCVVTYILDRPEGAVIFDAEEERAIRSMVRGGLLPIVRWRPRNADTG
jgi:hypothetical protein